MLYRSGTGFFPVPLPGTGFTPPVTQEAKEKRARTFSKRILVREEAIKLHPAIAGLYTDQSGNRNKEADRLERLFYFPVIDQHWPITRLGKWRDDHSTQELFCIPNERPMKDYEAEAVSLIDAIRSRYSEPKFEKYRPAVDPLLKRIREVSSDDLPLTQLAAPLDRLLADQINEGDAAEALLREFWNQPEMMEVKKKGQSLRDSTKFGDPLYFARRFGSGRVTVFTVPVGKPWSDLPEKECWPPIMTEMQKYLAGGGSEENRTVGTPYNLSFESGRYKPTAGWVYLSTETPKPGTVPQTLAVIREPKAGVDPNKLALDTKDGALRMNFTDNTRPGAYLFSMIWQKRDGDPASAPAEKPEFLAETFNVDSAREGDLRRTNADEFKSTAKGAEVHSVEDVEWLESLKQKQTDLSSGRWIYLFILLVLIFEQAMAVRLSYHTRSENLEAFAPSAAAAFARGTPPAVTDVGAVPESAEAVAEGAG
jgi:hypothetical protein